MIGGAYLMAAIVAGAAVGRLHPVRGARQPGRAARPAQRGCSCRPSDSRWSSTSPTPRVASSPGRRRTSRPCASCSTTASPRSSSSTLLHALHRDLAVPHRLACPAWCSRSRWSRSLAAHPVVHSAVPCGLPGVTVASARLIVKFVETMTGMRAVQAFRRERPTRRATPSSARSTARTLRSFRLTGVLDPSLQLIGNLTVVIALAIGGYRVLDGDMEVGVLVATLLYTKRFFQPVQQMAMFYNSFQSASAALEKISGLLEEQLTVRPSDARCRCRRPRQPRVRRRHVRLRDRPLVLPSFDLHVPAGQTVALVGATGAGKSTLAKLDRAVLRRQHGRRSDWTASTCATCPGRICAERSSWSRRRPTCSAGRCATTSRSAARRDRRGHRAGRPGRRRARVHLLAARRLRHRRQQAWRPGARPGSGS